jgi:ATP-dependent exoDNAse (exonuclease V) beta subunit
MKPPAEARTWAQWGQYLADAHPELELLLEAPKPAASAPVALAPLEAPPLRAALPPVELSDAHTLPSEAGAQARQEGEAIHAFLRDLLVRWEDPTALAACLAAAPKVAQARENAFRFLAQFEARGWRLLRRRTELPLPGAAASGAMGRADLVVWDGNCLRLLDFKHSKTFGAEELAEYRQQLSRYADVLGAREDLPVEAWLVALRSGEWVRVG